MYFIVLLISLPLSFLSSLTIKMNGWTLYYEKINTGEKNVVFIHGNNASINYWRKIMPFIPENWTAYFIDLPGFGKSDNHPPYTIDALSEVIAEFIKKMKIYNPIIVAHSVGGLVTLNAIVKKLIKPEKIALVDTAPADGYPVTDEQVSTGLHLAMTNKTFLYYTIKSTLGISIEDEKLLNQLVEDAMRSAPHGYTDVPKSWAKTIIIDKLKNVKCPVLFIHGEWDNVIPLDWLNKTIKAIKGSKFVVIEGAYHAPMLVKQKEFMDILVSFINK